MARYGRDFMAMDRGRGRYDRDPYGYRSGGRFQGGERMRGDWVGEPGPRRYSPAREPWGPRGGGYGDSRQPRGLPPGDWAAGQPWGGTGDVDRVRAADLMTENPEAVTADTPLVEVARRMRDLDVGIIPVVDGPDSFRLQGVITDRDIAVRAAAEAKDMNQARAGDHMTREVETVAESDGVREVLTVMKRQRVRRVPVTDAAGRLTGIIAQADLAVHYAGLDVQREREVEEVVERISEPARPNWGGQGGGGRMGGRGGQQERDLTDRLRQGWHSLREEAQHLLGRGYDRDMR